MRHPGWISMRTALPALLALAVASTAEAGPLEATGDEGVRRGPGAAGTSSVEAQVIYVNAAAQPGGDGQTRWTAFDTVAAGVEAACALGSSPTVSIAPGTYVEKNIAVPCSMTLRGETPVVTWGPDGFPKGAAAHPTAQIVADPPLAREDSTRGVPPGHSESLFLVTSSDVRIESLALDGGHHPEGSVDWRNGAGIQMSGGTGDVGVVDPRCPETAGIDGITLRDIAATGTGIAVYSAFASLSLEGSYLEGNGIGAALHAGEDATVTLSGNTLTSNGLYGLGTYGNAPYDVMACGYDVGNLTAYALTANIIGNKIANQSGLGAFRNLIRLQWSQDQPDTPASLHVHALSNVFEGNASYGPFIDFVLFPNWSDWGATVESPSDYEGVYLDNEYVDSGPRSLHVGFTQTGWSLWYDWYEWDPLFTYEAEAYARNASVELTISPPLDFDYNNPVQGCLEWDGEEGAICRGKRLVDLNNTLTVNGEAYVGRRITW